jgi:hypothetical protein
MVGASQPIGHVRSQKVTRVPLHWSDNAKGKKETNEMLA